MVAALVLWTYRVPDALSRAMVLNLGVPQVPYLAWVFLAVPVVLLVAAAVHADRLRLPHFRAFLAVELVIWAVELGLLGHDLTPRFRYAWGLLLFYSAFVALVNGGTDPETRTLVWKASLGSTAVLSVIVLLGIVGVLDVDIAASVAGRRGLEAALEDRVAARKVVHPNGYGFGSAVAILFLFLWREGTGRRSGKHWLLVALFFLPVLLQASRGNTVLIVCLLGGYALLRARELGRAARFGVYAAVFGGIVALALVYVSTGTLLVDQLFIADRFASPDQYVSRLHQVYVSWVKFLEAPLLGNGFQEAATGVLGGYARSNFHPTQILAAYGLVGFAAYVWLLYRMFGRRLWESWYSLHALIALFAFSFYNWSLIMPLALVAYSAYGLRGTESAAKKFEVGGTGTSPGAVERAG